ncbi:hypothetical protein EB796_002801 [Bugula neritina]|uniref:GRN n=1 Tax=Bugula neritina TaxID=10212 RepID=A0A7J7KLE2_BUGNE|nr:hypothetical protein EB796_002801 [Bugula neritina]
MQTVSMLAFTLLRFIYCVAATYTRPPAPSARCPNSQEPTGTLGPECISKSQCHPGDLCCKSYNTNSMNCMSGMRLEQVTPSPHRCGLPPPGPQTEEEECSPDWQCPIGYICCPTNSGSPLNSICRK